MAENDGNDSKNSGCMATGKHDSAGHDPDVQVTFAQNSPDQKNPLTQTPVVTAVIYAATFAATCVLYNYIGWHLFYIFLLLVCPGYVIIPSVALMLTRKVRVLRNPLWLVSTANAAHAASIAESDVLSLWAEDQTANIFCQSTPRNALTAAAFATNPRFPPLVSVMNCRHEPI